MLKLRIILVQGIYVSTKANGFDALSVKIR